MFCTNCGSTLNDGAAFCTNCGQKMAPASAVAQPVTPAQVAPVESVAPVAAAPVEPIAPQPVAVDPYAQPAAPQPVVADPYAQPAAPQPVAADPYAQPVAPQPVAADPYAQNAAYTQQPQQGAYTQPQQGAYVQPTAQPAPAVQPTAPAQPKKKSKLGLILGLAIGIPVLIIALCIGGCVACTNGLINRINEVVDEEDDDDDIKDPEPEPEPEPNGEPELEPVTVSETATRTVMIYIVGSNLESPEEWGATGGAATEDIYEMLAADIPEDVNVVLECGGAYEWEYPTVPDGAVSRHIIKNKELVLLENLGRTTMTQYGDLTDFINYASANYPAENYTLLLWDHGGSVPISYGMDQLGDEDDLMTDAELKVEIENSGIHFDTVIFDACNMCTLEIGMALADSSDYMVGAESYVNGIGIYYTNWLAQTDGSTATFCETIVEDYMDTINSYGLVGSMSVIRLDRIDEVYDAYEDYIATVDYNVYSLDDYNNYIKARGNCGQYYGTDSVDLTTLANKYETNKSSALINAVSNAVVYTESDMPYGHGITAYSPYDYFHIYNEGRTSFIAMNYSDTIISFYDKLVSQMLSYYGSDAVAAYGGDWFVDDFTVAAPGSSSNVTMLNVQNMGNYYAVPLDDDDWDIISTVATAVVVNTDDGTSLVLGQDFQYMLDDYDYVAIVDPEYWYYLNGSIATFYATSDYYDPYTGDWSTTGYIPVTVNGETAALYIYFDQNNPGGLIQGYYYFNYDTLSREDNTMYMITDDQEFRLYYPCLGDNDEPYYLEGSTAISGDDLLLELYYIDLDSYTTFGYIEIVDVYGNTYQTEHMYFSSRNSVY